MNPTDIQREARELAEAIATLEHDIGFCGYLRMDATKRALPLVIKAAKEAQRIQQEGAEDGERMDFLDANMNCLAFLGVIYQRGEYMKSAREAIDRLNGRPDERKET